MVVGSKEFCVTKKNLLNVKHNCNNIQDLFTIFRRKTNVTKQVSKLAQKEQKNNYCRICSDKFIILYKFCRFAKTFILNFYGQEA